MANPTIEERMASIVDSTQIRGYYVVTGREQSVSRLLGTPTGRPFQTEEAAEKLAKKIEDEYSQGGYFAFAVPVFTP